jgi:stearoyl-CoA desaturase (Delta-9 desaturase)
MDIASNAGRLWSWFDSWHGLSSGSSEPARGIDWWRALPFAGLHLAALAVLAVGWSPIALWVAVSLYLVRMFAITGFYHRYFSHKSFRANRGWQFVFAFLAGTAAQRGPLWWASHHRHHHRCSDREGDHHSPSLRGLIWSHVGWIASRECRYPNLNVVREWLHFPELRFLDRFDKLAPLSLIGLLYASGEFLASFAPALQTSGMQLVVWGFVISTLVLWHATFTVNSLAHSWGKRRFATRDDSRNNLFLALITLGEGWHNNHHYFSSSCRQGFFWWEVDVTWYVLRVLARLGVVSDLRPVPARVYTAVREQS